MNKIVFFKALLTAEGNRLVESKQSDVISLNSGGDFIVLGVDVLEVCLHDVLRTGQVCQTQADDESDTAGEKVDS